MRVRHIYYEWIHTFGRRGVEKGRGKDQEELAPFLIINCGWSTPKSAFSQEKNDTTYTHNLKAKLLDVCYEYLYSTCTCTCNI